MSLICNSVVRKGFSFQKKFVIARDRAITSCADAPACAMLSSQTMISSVSKPSSMQLGMQQETLMTTARNLTFLLCLAASLTVIGGARAADLPVKAKAVEYVRACSLYGAGFFYIPGTDTCIKFGGYLRVDTTFNAAGVQDQPSWNGDAGQGNRYHDYFSTRLRLAFTVDTRTASEYGVVRTFGKSASAYATPWHGYPGNNSSNLLGGHDTVTGVNNIQYTAQFGNGVSGTIGVDDPTVFNRTSVFNLTTGINATGTTGNAYAGVHSPDVVGNIRIDQAWGLFQISAAAHEVDGSYNSLTASTAAPLATSEISGHPDTKWGGSVMAALNIKNIPTGPGDDLKMDVSYAKGNTKNVISTAAGSPSFAMFGSSGRADAYQSVGFGATTDAVYLPAFAGGDGS